MFEFWKKKTKTPPKHLSAPAAEEPPVCGGTESSYDETAPTVILSEEMTYFCVHSAFAEPIAAGDKKIGFLSAFAAPAEEGTFLFLEIGDAVRKETTHGWALVSAPVFPALTALVKEQDLAAENGKRSYTHGLPEDFGGSVEIDYASGEKIRFSNNQTPVFSSEAGDAILKTFATAMQADRIPLPEVDDVTQIRFTKTSDNGEFTKAALVSNEEGSVIVCSRRFSDGTVQNRQRPANAETAALIRGAILEGGCFAWTGLPVKKYAFDNPKTLTFVFEDGSERTVLSDRLLPEALSGAFYKIESALTSD